MPRLAIVGAGLAGLAAAFALREHPIDVVLFEKSRGVSGRAATRGRHGVRYDHGANYAKLDDDRVEALVRRALPAADLVAIGAPIWTFDGDGTIAPGDPDRDDAEKWTYTDGISTLGKRLHEAGGGALRTQTRIAALARVAAAWRLADTDGRSHGPFDAVLLTPPAPQTAALLAASRFDDALRGRLEAAVRAARYRTQLTAVLAFDHPVARPGGAYALVNTDGAHPIAWLGFEEAKPGHVPDGTSVLVVQMAPDWSRAHYDDAPHVLARAVRDLAAALLGDPLGEPVWSDRQGWRYALPDTPADVETLRMGADHGLFFAGDYVAGRGRIGAAIATGLDAAPRIREQLGLG